MFIGPEVVKVPGAETSLTYSPILTGTQTEIGIGSGTGSPEIAMTGEVDAVS